MLSRRRVVLAVNPTASFGRHASAGEAVAARLTATGHEVRVIVASDAVALASEVRCAIDAGAEALVVVGGDGMVHLGVNAVAGGGVPLGIVPTGTGNDFARGLGLAVRDVEAATSQLVEALRRPARAVDAAVVEVGGRRVWFAGVLSAGFDARVNERANRLRRPRGASRYLLALLWELAGLHAVDYSVAFDGGAPVKTTGLLSAVANNAFLGGGMRIAPDAVLDDGALDVVFVRPLGRLRFLRFFPRVFRGTHTDLPQVRIERARTVALAADGVVAYADGERLGRLPVRVEVMPRALRVLV